MSQSRLPSITHLQFVVLHALVDGEQRGRAIRQALARVGIRRSGPAFYQMMARLEDAGLLQGDYDQKVVRGQLIKERRYVLTAAGARALAAARDFYAARIEALRAKEGISHA